MAESRIDTARRLLAQAAPILMMSQNRHGEIEHLQAHNDYEVNLKAELEIEQLHQKFDALRETSWVELVKMRQQQIEMLERLLVQNGTGGTCRPPA